MKAIKHKTITVGQEQVAPHSYPPDKGGEGGYIPYNKTVERTDRKARKPSEGGYIPYNKTVERTDRKARKPSEGGYIPYNKTLTQKARENRKNPTSAEKKLWYEALSNKRLGNLKFTRQKPLDEYIVDFYCAELMLAIEIDGDTHAGQEQYDKRRTENLNKYGVEVIRYTNAEVLNNLEGVYHNLCERISAIKSPKSETP